MGIQGAIWKRCGIRRLFKLLTKKLIKQKLILSKGKIVDATIVEVPRQRNTCEENKDLKKGEMPEHSGWR